MGGWEDAIACEWREHGNFRHAISGSNEGRFGAARGELADDWREK